MVEKVRVVQFADFVNRYDFVDTIVRRADPDRFSVGLCVRTRMSNIATPVYSEETPYWVIGGPKRSSIPKTVWQLVGILRKWRADILHTHHFDQAAIGWLATRIYPATRLIIGRHYSDALYRLPQQGISERKKWALLRIEQLTNRAASRIIVPSRYIRDILSDWQQVPLEKIDLIPYGFEPEKYGVIEEESVRKVREEFALDGRFVIATLARLNEEKGHRFLIEALRKVREEVPNILWLIVGDGIERAAIEREIANAALKGNITLAGWRRDGMNIMAAVDAIVQPTLQEAFSQAMVEALWMQKPLVITDVSGAPDLIRHGENGMLVPQRDSGALANAITQLARDASLRSRLGKVGRAHVQEHLGIEKIIGRYESAYLRAMRI
jgi:glycosyltransferase involved in cell wall biosynthesis